MIHWHWLLFFHLSQTPFPRKFTPCCERCLSCPRKQQTVQTDRNWRSEDRTSEWEPMPQKCISTKETCWWGDANLLHHTSYAHQRNELCVCVYNPWDSVYGEEVRIAANSSSLMWSFSSAYGAVKWHCRKKNRQTGIRFIFMNVRYTAWTLRVT